MIRISVIIPVHNNKEKLIECLNSLNKSTYTDREIIVVDDASNEDIQSVLGNNMSYYRLETQSGPAAARNLGASHAKGDILMFLDSDILVEPDTISQVISRFEQNPEISAIFGSYDSESAAMDCLSQYKNLLHHFVHQNSSPDANTFWAGCGAIRRSVFEEVGGFDETKYRKSSIEDIELGYRLKEKGCKIFLDKDIQVKHLKSWKFRNWLNVEIFNRAIPWSKLITETGTIHSDLNLRISDRISAVFSWIILLDLINLLTGIITGKLQVFSLNSSLIILIISLVIFVFLNKKFYYFLLNHRGIKFCFFITPFHILYYLYSSASFALVKLNHYLSRG